MFGNLGRVLRGGFRRIRTPLTRVFSFASTVYSYLGIVKFAKKLPGFAVNQKVFCEARVPVLHKHQRCKYVSSQCHKNGLEIEGNYLLYKGKRYPITPLVGEDGGDVIDVAGNKLFAINTGGTTSYQDFESKLEENKVLVVAYDGVKCVDPVSGKGSREVMMNFRAEVYPFSFSVIDYETKEVNILLSLLMFPFNISGLVLGCAGRLCAGLICALADGLKVLSEHISDRIDQKIIHQQSGVLTRVGKGYILASCLVFVLSTLANVFSLTSSLLKNLANFAESVLRFPTGILNGLYNCNMKCLPVKAGGAAMVDSLKATFKDLKSSCKSFGNTILSFKARLCKDESYLRSRMSGRSSGFLEQDDQCDEHHGKDEQSKKKRISQSDLKEITSIGKDLGMQEVAYGTSGAIEEQSKQKKGTSIGRSM